MIEEIKNYIMTPEGAEWFTGGQFGPEGSIQATIFCLIATSILLILSHKEGKIIKPYWKNNEPLAEVKQ